jgi:hypothetical protein
MHLLPRRARLLVTMSFALCFSAQAQSGGAPEPGGAEDPVAPADASSRTPPTKEPERLLAPVAPPPSSDPWSSRRVVLLAERLTYRVDVLSGDVLSDFLSALPSVVATPLTGVLGGERFRAALGSGRAEATIHGGRLELGNWGFSFGVGTGELLSGGLGDVDGGQQPLPFSVMTGAISVSLGAWAPLDIGGFRLRIGVAWPEVHLRFTRATVQSPDGETSWLGLQIGASALGVRVTLGELLFLEARLGEANVQVAYLMRGNARALQRGYGFDLLPTFRAGLSF